MSSTNKLTLPTKLSYGFTDANKLTDEVIDLCMRHDLVHLLQTESVSNWRAVQLSKLETLLKANNSTNKLKDDKIYSIQIAIEEE